jgi:hypothetical protein
LSLLEEKLLDVLRQQRPSSPVNITPLMPPSSLNGFPETSNNQQQSSANGQNPYTLLGGYPVYGQPSIPMNVIK